MAIIAACIFLAFCFLSIFIINKNVTINYSTRNKIEKYCKENGLQLVSYRQGSPIDHLLHGGHTTASVFKLVVLDKSGEEKNCLCIITSQIFTSNYSINLIWGE